MQTFVAAPEGAGVPVWLATDSDCAAVLQSLPSAQAVWARAQGFAAERHRLQLLPDDTGAVAGAVLGLGPAASADELSLWDAALLAERLPAGTYRVATALSAQAATQFVLGWLLGGYRVTRYRTAAAKALHKELGEPPEADSIFHHNTDPCIGLMDIGPHDY